MGQCVLPQRHISVISTSFCCLLSYDPTVGAEDNLSRTGLVDKKGNIVPDSHFIFTALPNADFMAESACERPVALALWLLLLSWQTAK